MNLRLPLTGLLLLPVCCGLALGLCRTPELREPKRASGLRPIRPRWTPPPAPPATQPPAWADEPVPVQPTPTGDQPSPVASPAGGASVSAPLVSIPGIDADGLLTGLQRSGLQCSPPALDKHGLTWTCSADALAVSYLVVLRADRKSSVAWLRASVEAGGDFVAAGFLQDVAALNYSDAEPARARDWVRRTMPAGGATEIGAVRFELSGATGHRVLDVTAAGLRR